MNCVNKQNKFKNSSQKSAQSTLSTQSTIKMLTKIQIQKQKQKLYCNVCFSIFAMLFWSFSCQMMTTVEGQQLSVKEDFRSLLGKCQFGLSNFDDCMKDVFNDFRAYYQTGLCDLNKNWYIYNILFFYFFI